MQQEDTKQRETTAGIGFALAAFGLWGANPIYFKLVDHLSIAEVIAHRVLWTVVMLAILLTIAKHWLVVGRALRDRQTLAMLLLSTSLITINWFTYIWAIGAERVLETSLGYFINPLVNVLLGVLVLRERLSPLQAAAVALAAIGVLNLSVRADGFPWVALTLAFTFGFYGLIRKTVRVGSADGLFIETSLMLPVAAIYLLFLAQTGGGHFLAGSWSDTLLLLAAGLVTATPLLCFTSAARRLRLSTIGMFQYLAPSCQFLLAIFAFGEPFSEPHLVTFLCIWLALAIFSFDSLNSVRRTRAASAPAGE